MSKSSSDVNMVQAGGVKASGKGLRSSLNEKNFKKNEDSTEDQALKESSNLAGGLPVKKHSDKSRFKNRGKSLETLKKEENSTEEALDYETNPRDDKMLVKPEEAPVIYQLEVSTPKKEESSDGNSTKKTSIKSEGNSQVDYNSILEGKHNRLMKSKQNARLRIMNEIISKGKEVVEEEESGNPFKVEKKEEASENLEEKLENPLIESPKFKKPVVKSKKEKGQSMREKKKKGKVKSGAKKKRKRRKKNSQDRDIELELKYPSLAKALKNQGHLDLKVKSSLYENLVNFQSELDASLQIIDQEKEKTDKKKEEEKEVEGVEEETMDKNPPNPAPVDGIEVPDLNKIEEEIEKKVEEKVMEELPGLRISKEKDSNPAKRSSYEAKMRAEIFEELDRESGVKKGFSSPQRKSKSKKKVKNTHNLVPQINISPQKKTQKPTKRHKRKSTFRSNNPNKLHVQKLDLKKCQKNSASSYQRTNRSSISNISRPSGVKSSRGKIKPFTHQNKRKKRKSDKTKARKLKSERSSGNTARNSFRVNSKVEPIDVSPVRLVNKKNISVSNNTTPKIIKGGGRKSKHQRRKSLKGKKTKLNFKNQKKSVPTPLRSSKKFKEGDEEEVMMKPSKHMKSKSFIDKLIESNKSQNKPMFKEEEELSKKSNQNSRENLVNESFQNSMRSQRSQRSNPKRVGLRQRIEDSIERLSKPKKIYKKKPVKTPVGKKNLRYSTRNSQSSGYNSLNESISSMKFKKKDSSKKKGNPIAYIENRFRSVKVGLTQNKPEYKRVVRKHKILLNVSSVSESTDTEPEVVVEKKREKRDLVYEDETRKLEIKRQEKKIMSKQIEDSEAKRIERDHYLQTILDKIESGIGLKAAKKTNKREKRLELPVKRNSSRSRSSRKSEKRLIFKKPKLSSPRKIASPLTTDRRQSVISMSKSHLDYPDIYRHEGLKHNTDRLKSNYDGGQKKEFSFDDIEVVKKTEKKEMIRNMTSRVPEYASNHVIDICNERSRLVGQMNKKFIEEMKRFRQKR